MMADRKDKTRTLSFRELTGRLRESDVLSAAKRIAEDGIPPNRRSTHYDVFVNGAALPPKLVLEHAVHVMARRDGDVPPHWGENGRGFYGGPTTNKVLESLGFEVRIRESETGSNAVERLSEELEHKGEFVSDVDRDWVWRSIAIRRGQPAFRKALIDAYDERCAITHCDVIEALEAAHILPFADGGPATTANGLLLRADLHTLFDLHLITIDPETLTVRLHPKLHETQHGEFEGKPLRIPKCASERPEKAYLEDHFGRSQISWKNFA